MVTFVPIVPAMDMRCQIITVANQYATARAMSRSRVSTLVFNRGTKIADIEAGGDLSTRIFERAMQWFSDHWPDGAAWPADVPRPAVQTVEVAQ